MSLYAHFDNQDGGDVATNTGWRHFCAWVESLDNAENLRHLTEYGWSQDIPVVTSELLDALGSGEPSSSVAATGEGLLGKLRDNADATVIVISDGTTHEPEIIHKPGAGANA